MICCFSVGGAMTVKHDIKKRLVELEDDDIKIRDIARLQLAAMGQEAVPDLVHQLKTDKEPCRREAAKILGKIQDKSAADDLVEALLDESIGVEWAASEALIKYGSGAIIPLLEGITHHFESTRFRQRAFHVLHELDRDHYLHPKVKEVMDSLRGMGRFTGAAWMAERALEYLKFGSTG
jgi:HEAT repeat protein